MSKSTSRATPKYNLGDRVEVPARKSEGTVDHRWYSEEQGWLYQVYRAGGDRQIGIYRERDLTQ